jgi:hypothetical protein
MVRSVLAAAGFLLALAGIGVFVAVGYMAWVVRVEADRQLAAAHAKAELAADTAAHTLTLVRDVISRAEQDLAAARTEAALAPKKDDVNPLVRLVVREQARNLPGKVEQARDAVSTASDAVVVASAALNVFSQFPTDESTFGVSPAQVHAARNQLDEVATDLHSARRVLGIPVPRPDGPATPEQLSAVDNALSRARAITDELEGVLGRVRSHVTEVRAKAELWVWRTAVAITALSALALLGQLFMARACWRALRRREW